MITKEEKLVLLGKINTSMEKFKETPFLAPITTAKERIQVRINGLVLSLHSGSISSNGPCFYWWNTEDLKTAIPIREAVQAEISAYLSLFPRARMLVLALTEVGFWAVYSRPSDIEYTPHQPVFVHASLDYPNVAQFDEVICRFDGSILWYERTVYEDATYMQVAAHCRGELGRETAPIKFNKMPGTTDEHLHLYKHLWDALRASKVRSEREVLEDAVAHAGGILDTFEMSGDICHVYYSIDGEKHRSSVRKDLQTISTQGVCLAGEDSFFDLQSIVSLAARWDQGER